MLNATAIKDKIVTVFQALFNHLFLVIQYYLFKMHPTIH